MKIQCCTRSKSQKEQASEGDVLGYCMRLFLFGGRRMSKNP